MLEPRLTPERINVGGLSFMISATPIITQSVGVPVMAKRFALISRRRSGRVSVSECDAPDCSVSGAQTHTSSVSARAIFSAISRPGAWMPSSLVTRMRCLAVIVILFPPPFYGGVREAPDGRGGGGRESLSPLQPPPPPRVARHLPRTGGGGKGWRRSQSSNCFLDLLHAAHIRHQHVRNANGAVRLLIVFHDRDQRAAHREAGTVQRVDEAFYLAILAAIARLHPPRLEVAAVGAGGNFAEAVLARQENFDVVSLLRRETHVASAERDDTV